MTAVAAVAICATILSAAATWYWRKTSVIKTAQVDFLAILLLGLFFISVGASLYTVEPTDMGCIARTWLVLLGYTLTLIPRLVKIAAINTMMNQANKMRQVTVTKKKLYGTVAIIVAFVVSYLIVWTAVDPMLETISRQKVKADEEDSSVLICKLCTSSTSTYNFWTCISLGALFLVLFGAAILAFQSRNVLQDFNESTSLALSAYSHFIIATIRVAGVVVASTTIQPPDRIIFANSFLFSADVLLSLGLYFGPKF